MCQRPPAFKLGRPLPVKGHHPAVGVQPAQAYYGDHNCRDRVAAEDPVDDQTTTLYQAPEALAEQVETEDGQYAFEFIISMEKDSLKGVFIGTSGESDMEKLSYEDNKLTFTVNVEAGGQSMAIDFSATIEGNTLDGMLSLEFGEANISGKKRKYPTSNARQKNKARKTDAASS